MNRYEDIARALHPAVYASRDQAAYAHAWPMLVDDVHELYWAVADHLSRELEDAGLDEAATFIRALATSDHPTDGDVPPTTGPHATVLPFTPRHATPKDPQ